MKVAVKIYSKIYMDEEDTSWSARPSRKLMRRIYHGGEESARWVANIEMGHISLGAPVDFHDEYALFVPNWFLESSGLDEDGTVVDVEFKRSEDLQKATRLSFKVMGDIPADLDIRDLLEEPLSQLGVIEVGQTIPIPVLEDVLLLLQECEPDGLVFLDGAEIALDIENDNIKVPLEPLVPLEPFEPLVPSEPSVPSEPFDDDFSVMLPSVKSGFIPFQGTGYRL